MLLFLLLLAIFIIVLSFFITDYLIDKLIAFSDKNWQIIFFFFFHFSPIVFSFDNLVSNNRLAITTSDWVSSDACNDKISWLNVWWYHHHIAIVSKLCDFFQLVSQLSDQFFFSQGFRLLAWMFQLFQKLSLRFKRKKSSTRKINVT